MNEYELSLEQGSTFFVDDWTNHDWSYTNFPKDARCACEKYFDAQVLQSSKVSEMCNVWSLNF